MCRASSVGQVCDITDGVCSCKCTSHWTGDDCTDCSHPYHRETSEGIQNCDGCQVSLVKQSFSCISCSVTEHCSGRVGAEVSTSSDQQTCLCECPNNWSGSSCDYCPEQYHPNSNCLSLRCPVCENGGRYLSVDDEYGNSSNCSCSCFNHWEGQTCESCPDKYNDPSGSCSYCKLGFINYPTCRECDISTDCNEIGTLSVTITSDNCYCKCKDQWIGDQCQTCPDKYSSSCNTCSSFREGYPTCDPCTIYSHCNNNGFIIHNCRCVCSDNWFGSDCSSCDYTKYNSNCNSCASPSQQSYPSCVDCTRYPCNSITTNNVIYSQELSECVCNCKPNWSGTLCTESSVLCNVESNCSTGADHATLYSIPSSVDVICLCNCKDQWTGSECNKCHTSLFNQSCNGCAEGYINYPHCIRCDIQHHCSGLSHATTVTSNTNNDGCLCSCDNNFTGDQCQYCPPQYEGSSCDRCNASRTIQSAYPKCLGCENLINCVNGDISLNKQTDECICTCKEMWTGIACDNCQDGYLNDNTCGRLTQPDGRINIWWTATAVVNYPLPLELLNFTEIGKEISNYFNNPLPGEMNPYNASILKACTIPIGVDSERGHCMSMGSIPSDRTISVMSNCPTCSRTGLHIEVGYSGMEDSVLSKGSYVQNTIRIAVDNYLVDTLYLPESLTDLPSVNHPPRQLLSCSAGYFWCSDECTTSDSYCNGRGFITISERGMCSCVCEVQAVGEYCESSRPILKIKNEFNKLSTEPEEVEEKIIHLYGIGILCGDDICEGVVSCDKVNANTIHVVCRGTLLKRTPSLKDALPGQSWFSLFSADGFDPEWGCSVHCYDVTLSDHKIFLGIGCVDDSNNNYITCPVVNNNNVPILVELLPCPQKVCLGHLSVTIQKESLAMTINSGDLTPFDPSHGCSVRCGYLPNEYLGTGCVTPTGSSVVCDVEPRLLPQTPINPAAVRLDYCEQHQQCDIILTPVENYTLQYPFKIPILPTKIMVSGRFELEWFCNVSCAVTVVWGYSLRRMVFPGCVVSVDVVECQTEREVSPVESVFYNNLVTADQGYFITTDITVCQSPNQCKTLLPDTSEPQLREPPNHNNPFILLGKGFNPGWECNLFCTFGGEKIFHGCFVNTTAVNCSHRVGEEVIILNEKNPEPRIELVHCPSNSLGCEVVVGVEVFYMTSQTELSDIVRVVPTAYDQPIPIVTRHDIRISELPKSIFVRTETDFNFDTNWGCDLICSHNGINIGTACVLNVSVIECTTFLNKTAQNLVIDIHHCTSSNKCVDILPSKTTIQFTAPPLITFDVDEALLKWDCDIEIISAEGNILYSNCCVVSTVIECKLLLHQGLVVDDHFKGFVSVGKNALFDEMFLPYEFIVSGNFDMLMACGIVCGHEDDFSWTGCVTDEVTVVCTRHSDRVMFVSGPFFKNKINLKYCIEDNCYPISHYHPTKSSQLPTLPINFIIEIDDDKNIKFIPGLCHYTCSYHGINYWKGCAQSATTLKCFAIDEQQSVVGMFADDFLTKISISEHLFQQMEVTLKNVTDIRHTPIDSFYFTVMGSFDIMWGCDVICYYLAQPFSGCVVNNSTVKCRVPSGVLSPTETINKHLVELQYCYKSDCELLSSLILPITPFKVSTNDEKRIWFEDLPSIIEVIGYFNTSWGCDAHCLISGIRIYKGCVIDIHTVQCSLLPGNTLTNTGSHFLSIEYCLKDSCVTIHDSSPPQTGSLIITSSDVISNVSTQAWVNTHPIRCDPNTEEITIKSDASFSVWALEVQYRGRYSFNPEPLDIFSQGIPVSWHSTSMPGRYAMYLDVTEAGTYKVEIMLKGVVCGFFVTSSALQNPSKLEVSSTIQYLSPQHITSLFVILDVFSNPIRFHNSAFCQTRLLQCDELFNNCVSITTKTRTVTLEGHCLVVYNFNPKLGFRYRAAVELILINGTISDSAVIDAPMRECPPNSLLVTGNVECEDCPMGLHCNGTNTTLVQHGWWRSSPTDSAIECRINKNYCNTNGCQNGTSGYLCLSCSGSARRFSPFKSLGCYDCPSDRLAIAIATGLYTWFLLLSFTTSVLLKSNNYRCREALTLMCLLLSAIYLFPPLSWVDQSSDVDDIHPSKIVQLITLKVVPPPLACLIPTDEYTSVDSKVIDYFVDGFGILFSGMWGEVVLSFLFWR